MTDAITTIQGKSEAEEVAKIVQRLAEPKTLSVVEGDMVVHLLAHPQGIGLTNLTAELDKRRLAPRRKTGVAWLARFASFLGYVQRHRTNETVVYVHREANTWRFRAVFNGHGGGDGEPGFGDFGAVLTLEPSEALKIWSSVDGKKLTQVEFAELVEARIAEVVPPEAAGEGALLTASAIQATYASQMAMLALSKGLSIRVEANIRDAVELSSGETKLVYDETVRGEAGQDLKVPGAFIAAIPIFDGGVHYQIPIRIRFRAQRGAAVTWILQIYRLDLAIEDAIRGMIDELQAERLVVFEGKPTT